ncbi:MAG: M14 family zinc carboxypeptidase [Flavobacteriales bacterium]
MKIVYFVPLLILTYLNGYSQEWSGNTTPTYPELISHLQALDKQHKEIKLFNMGPSDYGLPIYLCVINGAKDSLKTFEKARNNTTILINNAIHAGEPDGVNACLLWLEQWIRAGKPTKSRDGMDLPVIAFIPAYNVGGMMNRTTKSRANQNGPEAYGFRGSAKNLDLNRDFIKMDASNSFTFTRIFHALDPDIFIDNHVSNGADYPYTLTYISSMKERLAPSMQKLTYESCIPILKEYCQMGNFELFPYVELKGETPESGIVAFNDLPRYAMGYASLFHSLSFTVETHMLKPFPERVQATLSFMNSMIAYCIDHSSEIESARNTAKNWAKSQTTYRFNFQLNEKQNETIRFKGYQDIYPEHPITGLKQLGYDRTQPYEKYIPYYNHYEAKDSISIPKYYIIGGQETAIIERLKSNQIQYSVIDASSAKSTQVNSFVIKDFKAPSKPYEGHFKLQQIQLEKQLFQLELKPGDILIPCQQEKALFIHAVLQPLTEDSYLSWNFFDSYLQQKEYFSPYVFKEQIAAILEAQPKLKEAYEKRKQLDVNFADSEWEQLYFIYQNSPYFEASFMRLPVFEVMK